MSRAGVVFLLFTVLAASAGAARVVPPPHRTLEVSPGVTSNERITALTGAALLVLTVVIGVTILRIGDLLRAHYVIGLLMLGPVALKMGSTGYRFFRYYTGSPDYRLAGPPESLLRLTAPVLVIATIAVFATGIELWLFGDRFGAAWFQAHVVSFIFWTVAVAVHLVWHTLRSAEAALQEVVATAAAGAFTPRGLVIGSLVLGAVMAAASLLYASPFQVPGGG